MEAYSDVSEALGTALGCVGSVSGLVLRHRGWLCLVVMVVVVVEGIVLRKVMSINEIATRIAALVLTSC
jgi:hypothetical protein